MPLPGWDHPILQRRRDAMREAVTSYLPLPARRAATRSTPVWTWFTRVALWVGIGMLVAVFAIATDPTKVAVVAILTAIAAPAWRELSWAFRTVIVLGLMWLSVADLGTAPVLGGCPAEPAPFRRGAATAGVRGHHARQHPRPRRAAANLGARESHLPRH